MIQNINQNNKGYSSIQQLNDLIKFPNHDSQR